MVITSRENKIYKLSLRLSEKRGRDENGLFLIEGVRSVRDAFFKGAEFSFVLLCEGTTFSDDFGCSVYTLAPRLFREISDTVNPQGIIAACRIPSSSEADILKRNKNLVIMCEAVQDPGNIGTVIRTAHAAGAGGVVLTKGCCDLFNPKIVRATMSGIFSIPVLTGADSEKIIASFKKNGYKVIAGALSERSTDLFSSDLRGKHLIIIGNEANGVKEETLSLCDSLLKIPMQADAESLNASVACGILAYEHLRQNVNKL